jgi:hypothetical protein
MICHSYDDFIHHTNHHGAAKPKSMRQRVNSIVRCTVQANATGWLMIRALSPISAAGTMPSRAVGATGSAPRRPSEMRIAPGVCPTREPARRPRRHDFGCHALRFAGPLSGKQPESGSVKGLRCGPLCSADGEAPGPASESLQGRKPRPGAVRYGDFAARLGLRERARRVTAARCSDRDARKPRVCCTWEGSGIAAGCISAIEPNGIARSLAETGSASSGCRRCAIVMRCRS